MKVRKVISPLILLICTASAFAASREEHRRDFQKTVALASGKSFAVDNSLGNIRIRTQSRAEADIRAVIKCSADTAAEAKAVCDAIQILVQDGSTGVTVRTEYPENRQRGRRNIGYGVDYDIAVPENSPLDVRNRFGKVDIVGTRATGFIHNSNGEVTMVDSRGKQQIDNSFGNVEIRNNSGDLIVRNGNGDVVINDTTGAVEVSNRFGKIIVARTGGAVTINSNNGTIEATTVGGGASIVNTFGAVTISGVKGDASVNNQNGSVRAVDIEGAAQLHTTFDRITFSRIGKAVDVQASNTSVVGDTVGENATIDTTFGAVDIRAIKGSARVTASNTSITLNDVGRSVDARTTFNGVTVNGGGGPIAIENQNGSVSVDAKSNRCEPMTLSTTFGPIRLRIPPGLGYDLSAHTTFGRISSEAELSLTGHISSSALTGKIAGGGCELRLTGKNSDIEIRKGTR